MFKQFLLPELMYKGRPALPPQKQDLKRLYRYIRESFATTVLEFGCGYSTMVIGYALHQNKLRFESMSKKPIMRNDFLFEGCSIDTNEHWLIEILSKSNYTYNISFNHRHCFTNNYNGQRCHMYDNIPPVNPDFIYLDGPDPAQVKNWNPNWTPMSADILYMEPILIPGTQILIDGRTNNDRFLANNFKRNWKIDWNMEEDYTHMVLDEPRLGKINAVGRDILDFING